MLGWSLLLGLPDEAAAGCRRSREVFPLTGEGGQCKAAVPEQHAFIVVGIGEKCGMF